MTPCSPVHVYRCFWRRYCNSGLRQDGLFPYTAPLTCDILVYFLIRLILRPWWRRQYIHPKRRYTSKVLCGVTSHETVHFKEKFWARSNMYIRFVIVINEWGVNSITTHILVEELCTQTSPSRDRKSHQRISKRQAQVPTGTIGMKHILSRVSDGVWIGNWIYWTPVTHLQVIIMLSSTHLTNHYGTCSVSVCYSLH
jgi:hypothetical protein